MQAKSVDIAITRARELCGGKWPTDEYWSVVDAVRRYAIGEGSDVGGHELAFRLGLAAPMDDRNPEADIILMHLINQRDPHSSVAEKECARAVNPSMWDLLSNR